MNSVSREVSRGDGEKEARRKYAVSSPYYIYSAMQVIMGRA